MYKTLQLTFVVFAWTAMQGQTLQTVIQRGHDQAVLSLACSPDSSYVISGSRDRSAKLWELSTGREVRSFLGHEGSINCIDVSADGKYIITSSSDRTARIWEVATGQEIFSSPPEDKFLTAAAFSPDMKFFITAGYPDQARVWDFKTKKVITTIDVNADQGLGYGVNLAFSPDGEWMAIGEDNRTANVYRTSTWEKVYSFKPDEGWCGGCATWVFFGRDNKSLFVASNKGPVKKYDLGTGKIVLTYSDEIEEVTSLLVSNDNKYVYVITKKSIITWDALGGNEVSEDTVVIESEINEAKISLQGTILLAADDNEVKVFDRKTKKITTTFTGILNRQDIGGVEYDPNSYWESHIAKYIRLKNKLLLSHDSKSLLKGKFGTKIKRWDIATGETLMEYAGHDKAPLCYSLSNDGTRLLTGGADGRIILWDAVTGDTLLTIKAHREPVFSVQFSHNEKMIMSGSWDATVKVFDITSGKQLMYFDFENSSSYETIFSYNDLYIFAAQLGQPLKMYEMDTKKVVREFVGHTDVVSEIHLSNDGKKLLSAGWDGSIRLWDVATGLMDSKFAGHKGSIYTARFSNDEKFVFSGGADRSIKVWDIASGANVKTFVGHQAEVTCILQSHDGSMLISHSTDGATKFWDLKTGKEFFEHIHIGKSDWLVRNTDGYFSGTDDARKSVHFVNGMKTYSVDQFFDEFYRPDLLPQIFKTRGSDVPGGTIQGKINSSPPPSVKIASLETSDPTKIELYLKITNEGNGVNHLKLFHNNKNIPIHRESLKLPVKKGEHTVYKQVVELVGGHNTFTAIATNDNNIESDPVSIEYFSDHASKSSTCYILAVGINEYKNPQMILNYARPDAQSMAQLLEQKTSSLYKSVELTTLYDREASAQNILKALDEHSHKVHPEDVFIFYYAGHGSMVDNRFFFIPTESIRLYDLKSLQKEALEATVLQEKLRHISALKQLIIMDACQSGGSVEVLGTRGAGEEKAIAQLSRSAGIHVMASAGSEQFASEFASLGHGLFTYLLIKGLEGEADGAPKDGKVTIYELKSFMDDQVPEMTKTMKGKPQYPHTFSQGQDFPVVLNGQ
jgi:WD40 repeat protein